MKTSNSPVTGAHLRLGVGVERQAVRHGSKRSRMEADFSGDNQFSRALSRASSVVSVGSTDESRHEAKRIKLELNGHIRQPPMDSAS